MEVWGMETSTLQVRMLGQFAMRLGERRIGDGDNRSRKAWLLLAYMIYCRSRSITQEELIDLLWPGDAGSGKPANALKTMFHRVRGMLDGLGDSVGRKLIIRQHGNYAWNMSVPLRFDADDFEALCQKGAAAKDDGERLESYLKALDLYKGDFLPKLSSETWVIPVNAFFHNLYVQTVRKTIPLLEKEKMTEQSSALCRRAIEIEPYDEEIYRSLMRNLLAQGKQREAAMVYRDLSSLLFSNFGVEPSDGTKELYRRAVRFLNDREVSLGTVREQLKESDPGEGALVCDYDIFKEIYRTIARSILRSGDAVHLGLITVSEGKKRVSRRSRDICMGNLLEIIRANLRKGDVVARCSIQQYVVLLQQANYENSCRVLERIAKAFSRKYPHSPVVLRYSAQPLEPTA